MILHRIDYNGGDIWVNKEAKIELGDWVFELQPKDNIGDVHFINGEYVIANDIQYKIVAQSPNLSLPNIPYVEIEEDVEQLAIKASNKIVISKNGQPDKTLVSHWLNGYKAASAKKWTDEDLRKAFEAGAELDEFSEPAAGDMCPKWKDFYEYLESLQPKPVNIEIETTCSVCGLVDAHKMSCKTESARTQVPVTNLKNGKTFVKVKKVNYES